MHLSQVTVIDTSSNVVGALTNGTVDAVITGQPNINRIKDIFGNQISIMPAQSVQAAYYGVLCTNSWATAHPKLIVRFINALAKAEDYMIKNPAEARNFIQNDLNYDSKYLSEVWSDHEFSLSLDQSLVVAMENEARWLISNNLSNQTVVPDFQAYIYLEGLTSVKPESVNVFR